MKSLKESILSSTNAGKWGNPFLLKTKRYIFRKGNGATSVKVLNDFCDFYKIEDKETKEDIGQAVHEIINKFWHLDIDVVLDKDVFERLQHALNRKNISIEHDIDYIPTLFHTEDISFVIKTTDPDDTDKVFWWVWHWGSKRDLFTYANSWLMIYPK